MHIHLIAIGRMQRGPTETLMQDYIRRLPWSFSVREIELKKPSQDTDSRKAQEAERLLAEIPKSAVTIALDERGKQLTSRDLARQIGRWQDDGIRDLALIIGGADGLDDSVRKAARMVLGLGALTWPHMLVRAMLAEQMYRSWAILQGHPYHRD